MTKCVQVNHIQFISVSLMLQYGDLDELTGCLPQPLEDNEYRKIKEALENLRAESDTVKQNNESLVEGPVSSTDTYKPYEHVSYLYVHKNKFSIKQLKAWSNVVESYLRVNT